MVLLSLALSTINLAATQRRLDQSVHTCAEEKVVRLIARSDTEVVIHMKIISRAPSSGENHRFDCVLKEMRRMTDLKFGFVGNEAYEPVAK